jgi:uncharacterized protein with HEPN domain
MRYVEGMNRAAFEADEKTFDAVIRNIEIIGEAAKSLPEVTRSRFTGVDWRNISRMRDVLAHHYFGVDKDIVWDVVSVRVRELASALGVPAG